MKLKTRRKVEGIILVFLCLLGGFIIVMLKEVCAVREVKTITIFGGFVENTKHNVQILSFPNPPDGVSEIYYAKAKVRADMTGTASRIYFHVNGQSCTPEYYSVSDKSWGYTMDFDCTNIITGTGNYSVTIDSNKNLQNIYVEWEITYKNNPPSTIASIGGTEYSTGEPSRIVLQILNNEGNPINNGMCFTTVRNSNDTVVVDNQSLNYIPDSNGLYFYEFVIQLPIGVYSTDSYCSLGGVNVYSGDTFHVAKWAENIKDVKNATDRPHVSFVGGTEYTQDEPVGIRTQFLKADGSPVTPYDPDGGGICEFDLFSPNYTQIFDDHSMTFINNSNGIYAYDWNKTGKDLGVYVVDVYCHKIGVPAFSAWGSSTFHVSRWAQGIMNMSINGTLIRIIYDLRFAGATEYSRGENGVFVVQFLKVDKGKPIPINDADWCKATFYYPNNSVWQSDVYFPYISGSNGLYYNISTIPDTFGAYTIDAVCKRKGIYTYSSDTFHVPSWVKSIGDLIQEHNTSVFIKLHNIQDEIANLNFTLINSTINITMDISKLPKNTYLYFQAVEDRLISNHKYCVNNTLRRELLIEKCVNLECFNITRNEDTVCPYGCDPEINECNPATWLRWLIIIGIIVGIIILVIFINWLIGKTEWFGVRK